LNTHTHTRTVLSKYLKVIFAAMSFSSEISKRPPTDPQLEPGFPSSHAMNIFYLSLFYTTHLELGPPYRLFVMLLACALSIMRVLRGHHTVAQVIVGALFGSLVFISFDFAIRSFLLAQFLDNQILSILDIHTRRIIFVLLSVILIYLFNLANNRWKRSFVKKTK